MIQHTNIPTIFRSQPASLTEDQVITMIKKYNFFDARLNKTSPGFANQFEVLTIENDQFVIDQSSGLMWQQGGSSERLTYKEIKNLIDTLNLTSDAGYDNWRLPTLEEAMSLMKPEIKSGDLHIDPIFSSKQSYIWTSDRVKGMPLAWIVIFNYGYFSTYNFNYGSYVRAVRLK